MQPVIARAPDVLARWPSRSVLTPAERQRAEAFRHPADGEAFVAAHLLARETVGAHLGIEAADVVLVQECDTCGGPHGRPRVVGSAACVSWSHSAGYVAAVAADSVIGIDVESTLGAAYQPSLAAAMSTAGERSVIAASSDPAAEFLRMWVRKEALVKTGLLTLDGFADTDVTSDELGGFRLHMLGYPGVVAAVAITAT